MPVEIGDRFEFVNATMESVSEFEVIHLEGAGIKGRLVHLRNLATDGIARGSVNWLLKPPPTSGGSHWRRAE